MSSIIGQLRIILGLETAAFETGASRAEARTKALGDQAEALGFKVGRMGKALAVAGAAVVGAVATQQIATLIKQGLDYASALGEQAQQLGVSTSALQEYRYAASQAGIEQTQMDAALAKLTRTMGEAAGGSKAQAAAFAKLGIDIKAFVATGRDAGDLVPLIAQGMKGLGSDSERAATGAALFGRNFQNLMPLLADGANGVNNLREQAHRLGLVISEDAIANADKTADDLATLSQVLSINISAIVAENSKEIGELATSLAELAVEGIKAANGWLAFRRATNQAAEEYRRADAYLSGRTDLSSEARENARRMARQIIDRRNGIKTEEDSYLGGLFTIRRQSAIPAPASPQSQAGTPAVRRVNAIPPETSSGGSERSGARRSASRARRVREEDPYKDWRGYDFEKVFEPFEKLAKGHTLEDIDQQMSDLIESSRDLKRETKDTAASMQRSFEESAQGILGSLSNLESAFRGGGFLSILSGVLDLGLQLGSVGAFGSKVAGRINSKSIPAYATGTSFHPGGLALVGERGPELVDLPRGAAVYPNGTGPGGDGGRTTVYNLSGNLLTPEFWAEIEKRDRVAAAAGAQGGMRLMTRARARTL